MKRIFRSPIEPEFAAEVALFVRAKREALVHRFRIIRENAVSRLQALWARALQTLRPRIEILSNRIRRVIEMLRVKTEPARVLIGRLREHMGVKNERAAEQPELDNSSLASVPSASLETEAPRSWKEKLRSHFSERQERYRWVLILVLGLVLGVGFKFQAHQTIVIGFEDYKVSRDARVVDLNAVQEKVMAGDGTLPVTPIEGEQCVE